MVREFAAGIDTAIGTLRVSATERGIVAVDFGPLPPQSAAEGAPRFLAECLRQLREYFEGGRTAFADLPLEVRGTAFQMSVWDALGAIPFGATRTYGDVAAAIGSPGAARAVGNALNRNPICIIVPCHRVVGAAPGSGGYAGGEERKAWLLAHEHA